jgi:hypothetical protein
MITVLVVCVASQYPGITLDASTYWDTEQKSTKNVSMESGFAAAFHISWRASKIITCSYSFIAGFCYMWASALQIKALADAQLLFPRLLKQREGESESPTRALIATLIFGFICFLAFVTVSWFGVSPSDIEMVLINIQTTTICLMYLCLLSAYVYFRTWGHGATAESYKNPCGRAGAVCAALIFLFVAGAVPLRGTIPTVNLRHKLWCCGVAAAIIAAYLGGMSVYYFRVAKEAQTTTDAESVAYLSIYAVKGMNYDYYYCYCNCIIPHIISIRPSFFSFFFSPFSSFFSPLPLSLVPTYFNFSCLLFLLLISPHSSFSSQSGSTRKNQGKCSQFLQI